MKSVPNRPVIALGLLAAVISMGALAETFTEQNRKVSYIRETGSGPDQKHAAIKLDNVVSLTAGCFEDILILDVSTEAGKKTLQQLKTLMEGEKPLKSLTFSKDEEGDCRLEGLQP